MASKQFENQSLDLDQLIGGPLMSLVQAETHAAKATVDFIEAVGFTKPKPVKDSESTSKIKPKNDSGNFGELRTVTFKYKKNVQGSIKTFEVKIPVLSLIPIPLLQIEKAELEFSVRIAEFVSSENLNNFPELSESMLRNKPMTMKATISPSSKTTSSNLQREMKVKMNLKQSDLPSGFARLIHMMDNGITEVPISENEKRNKNES